LESVWVRYVRPSVRCTSVIGVLVVGVVTVVSACVSPAARAQVSSRATVTRVVDGDTVDARLADGREVTVRLIGINAPESDECGAEPAREALRRLVEGQSVNLVSDPTQDAVDQFGRVLSYAERSSAALDVGEEMIRSGWAEVFVYECDFQRLPRYEFAAVEASHREAGVWARCEGDFHRTRADELRDRRLSAADFIRRYYSSISRRRFLTAGGCWVPACGRSSGLIGSGGRAIGVPSVRPCFPRAPGCRAAGRSSQCRCGPAIAMPVAGASSVSPSAAAGSSRPAEARGWRCECGCVRPAAAASASRRPSARVGGRHRHHRRRDRRAIARAMTRASRPARTLIARAAKATDRATWKGQ
jgi:micrococcal nuclease